MTRIHVKICGMRDPANISEVALLRPDFMGFIFYRDSPRFVGDNFSLELNQTSNVNRVGVFVNEKLDYILKQTNKYQLSYIQLHGDESLQMVKDLKKNQVRVIKVFRVDDNFDFSVTKSFADFVDFFLFDTRGRNYGGNASKFDWTLLEKYDQRIPFFLSGGIIIADLNHVKKMTGMNLYAIDVNSGVEVSPGLKDVSKIKELIKNLNDE